MNKTILIVDDDRTERRMITGVLRNTIEANLKEAEDGKDALRILKRSEDVVLIILDLDMPVMGGMDALEAIKRDYPNIPVIILTGNTDMASTIEAMKKGAVDFLSKPVESARLDVSARNALKMSMMSTEISRLKRQAEDVQQFSDLIGYDTGLSGLVDVGRKAAACKLPVLISGETGTGKEVFSHSIHGESNRAGQPFIPVNCGAIPEKLVESILFGHEKGAFTGAINKSLGKFQEANGGTIFLDEIGELPLEAQVKLLRVLQQSEVEPVGAGRSIPVDVRVISATNRDLSEEVKAGRFREDLYFRLNVLHIDLPPLRDRKQDIPALAHFFIDKFCVAHQSLPKVILDSALEKLQGHAWPGNVRELENVINRAIALCEGDELRPDNFSFVQSASENVLSSVKGMISPINEDGTFKDFKTLEQEIVALALAHHDGNMAQTARVLGIAKSTLYAKLENLMERKSA